MFTQKDTYPNILKKYKASIKSAVNTEHNDITDKIKPMKWTTNLVENLRVTEAKVKPIQNSDKQQAHIIKPHE